MFKFASPLWLILLVLPLISLVLYVYKKGRTDATVIFSDITVFKNIGSNRGIVKRMISLAIPAAALLSLIIAMARPQTGQRFHSRSTY